MDAKTVQVVAKELHQELDWATVVEAAKLTSLAAVKFTSWWLCGRGLHLWEAWEYDDGTVVAECACCQMQADASHAA
ncbi:MAG: hypothetical protein ABWZ91_11525 [Nocardioides sp.]